MGTVKPVRVSHSRLPTHEKSAVSQTGETHLLGTVDHLLEQHAVTPYVELQRALVGCASRTSSNVEVVSE
jgi:hypothetical protein